jgi:putative metallopeptidase
MRPMIRPRPPSDVAETILGSPYFAPAPDVLDWITATFLTENSDLYNEDHAHLVAARLGILWTSVANSRNGRTILGQCEFKPPGGTMGKWARERAKAQLYGWFGGELDFLITLDARYALACSDSEWCALVEHELYHAGQARDEFGGPKFIEATGTPVFCVRAHDIEEFTGVVKRYGAAAAHVEAFVAAAALTADVTAGSIAAACGTCGG